MEYNDRKLIFGDAKEESIGDLNKCSFSGVVETNLDWSGLRRHGGENVGWEETGQSWREHRVRGGFAFTMRAMTAHLSAEGNDLVEKGSWVVQERG